MAGRAAVVAGGDPEKAGEGAVEVVEGGRSNAEALWAWSEVVLVGLRVD